MLRVLGKAAGLILWSLVACSSTANGAVTYSGFDDIEGERETFVVVGDTQRTSRWEFWRERNAAETQRLLSELAARKPAFVIDLGDLTARGSSERQWDFFEECHKPLLEEHIPYFPILGNHDYYGDNRSALGNFFARFPHLEKRQWYSFTFNGVGFIMLNSNFMHLGKDEREKQDAWYQSELANMEKRADVELVIVCAHHPPYTNSTVVKPDEGVRSHFAEPFMRFTKTAMFFSGHCHAYERFAIGGKQFVVSGGGGGPRHRLLVGARSRFADEFNGGAVRFFHLCEIEVKKDMLDLRVIKLNDDYTLSEVDRVNIQHAGEGRD